ncbi:hypothetical protein FKP32DRAFT_473386 [Trametes sanguinea]|nr:hypothetical protein FKP32DRAFT_473386 [Trametes sanguinea]
MSTNKIWIKHKLQAREGILFGRDAVLERLLEGYIACEGAFDPLERLLHGYTGCGGAFGPVETRFSENEECIAVLSELVFEISDPDVDMKALHGLTAKADEGQQQLAVMYCPMLNVLRTINLWCGWVEDMRPKRRWVYTGSRTPSPPADFWRPCRMPRDEPPFLLRWQHDSSSDPPEPPENPTEDQSWIPYCAFLQLVASVDYDPATERLRGRNRRPSTGVLVQAAGHAQDLLRDHPFQLYVFGLLVGCDRYWVGMFDRGGIVLSDAHQIDWTSPESEYLSVFLKLHVRPISEMTPQEIGQDPTITLAARRWGPYPSFNVPIGRPTDARDVHQWTTVGPAIWSSESLVGRGTSFWTAMPHSAPGAGDGKTAAMLKQTWKAPDRLGEYEAYTQIKGLLESAGKSHAGLAHLLDGDDVYLPGSDEKLSLRYMRGAELCDDGLSVQDGILHRVVVQEVGRPLWEYENLEQLVRAVKCAVEGHRTLCDVGVIHGDIGPGNIMIQTKTELKPWKTDSTGTPVYEVEHTFPPLSDTKGFLLGYEFASFPDLRTCALQPEVPEDALTGRFIFKASEVLMGIHHNTPVSRTRSHDLQSFLWVILYVVYRRAVEEIPELREVEPMEHHERLRAEHNALFTVYGATDLLNSRAALFAKFYVHDMDDSKPPAACAGIQALLLHAQGDDALRRLLETIWIILKQCQPLNVAEEDVACSDLLQAFHSSSHCSEGAPCAPQPMDISCDGDEQLSRKTHEGTPFTQGRSNTPSWKSSAAAVNLSHDILLDLFTRVLQRISDYGRR